uniref:Uncharacterized protein n=1 Tax=Vespula pensylvanica TaxID=30213 RepID=A0A834PBT6_VESPE|nr:hypothetical protein H0235_003645 [Vespula pensylvanica]
MLPEIFNGINIQIYKCRGVEIISRIQIALTPFGSESGSVSSVNVDHGKPTNSWARPQFDDIAPKNITAIVGQTAELNCYVKRPGDRVNVAGTVVLGVPPNLALCDYDNRAGICI